MVVLVPFVETSTVAKDTEEYDFVDLAERLREKLQKHWNGKTFGITVYIVPGERCLVVESVSMAYFIVDNFLRHWTVLK